MYRSINKKTVTSTAMSLLTSSGVYTIHLHMQALYTATTHPRTRTPRSGSPEASKASITYGAVRKVAGSHYYGAVNVDAQQ
jgi:hypothetical protein